MASTKHAIWAEKYRPQTLNDYVFNDNSHKKSFEQMVSTQQIPHLLLSGTQGAGKTTMAQILIAALNVDPTDILLINGSDETGVDAMRDKIKSFISTFAMGSIKIVHIEEADYLSPSAQAVLRKYMEEFNNQARFILTCNYEHKLIPAIHSRVQSYRFKSADQDEITEFVAKILLKEKVKFDFDALDQYVAVGYPDIRKVIQLLQQNTIDGVLQYASVDAAAEGDYKFKLLDMITNDNWLDARKMVCSKVTNDEWEDLYRFLYSNLHLSAKFSEPEKWQKGQLLIAEYLYKHTIISDPEINASALFIQFTLI